MMVFLVLQQQFLIRSLKRTSRTEKIPGTIMYPLYTRWILYWSDRHEPFRRRKLEKGECLRLTITCLGTAHGLLNRFKQCGQCFWFAPDGSPSTLYDCFRFCRRFWFVEKMGLSTAIVAWRVSLLGANWRATWSASAKEPKEDTLLSSPRWLTTAMDCVRRSLEASGLQGCVWDRAWSMSEKPCDRLFWTTRWRVVVEQR